MKNTFVFFVLIVNNLRFSFSDMRFVNYTIISTASGGPRRQACARSYADNNYFAVKIDDVTGSCEGLTWTWGSNQQFDLGYSYFMKINTIEIYQPTLMVSGRFQWLIPGTFSLGGHLDLYISVPTGNSWQGFELNMLDTIENDFQIDDNQPETLMVHIQVTINSLMIKTWKDNYWNNRHSMSTPFVGGKAHKISLVPKTNMMEVSFDDMFVTEYYHLVSPSTAKQISLTPYENTAIGVYNITFVAY